MSIELILAQAHTINVLWDSRRKWQDLHQVDDLWFDMMKDHINALESRLGRVSELAEEWWESAGSGSDYEGAFGSQFLSVGFVVGKIREAVNGE